MTKRAKKRWECKNVVKQEKSPTEGQLLSSALSEESGKNQRVERRGKRLRRGQGWWGRRGEEARVVKV